MVWRPLDDENNSVHTCPRFGHRIPLQMCMGCFACLDYQKDHNRVDCQYRWSRGDDAYPPKGENKNETIYLPYSVYSALGYEFLIELLHHMGYDVAKTYPDQEITVRTKKAD